MSSKRQDKTKTALCLAGVLFLPLLVGCGHESAASPVANTAPLSPSLKAEPILEATNDRRESTPRSSSKAKVAADSVAETSERTDSKAAAAPPSPPPAPPAGQRPPADRTPARPGEAEKITFDDLNLGMPADVVFRPFMLTDRVKELEGKRVSIVGYMHGGQAAQRGIKEFILLKNTQCKFGPGGQADHLANVLLQADHSTLFTPSPIKVEGTLKLEPFQGPDGNTWSFYRLEDARIH